MKTNPSRPLTVTDSAGFWLVVFCGFGLTMLFLMHRTIDRKQNESATRAVSHANNELQGAYENVDAGQVSNRTGMSFVYLALGAGVGVGFAMLIRQQLLGRRAKASRDVRQDSTDGLPDA